MSILRKIEPLSVEDYLAMEQQSDVRHEYVGGMILDMVGSTERHNMIALNLASLLRQHLRGRGCRVFVSDMKVRVDDVFYYPDVMVVCGSPTPMALFQTDPIIIAEVLSDSTESRDRLEKLVAYQSLSTLQEYILLSQDKIRAEIYRHMADGWQRETMIIGDTVRIESIRFDTAIENLYEIE
jgi:Uma2 family endonuclease